MKLDQLMQQLIESLKVKNELTFRHCMNNEEVIFNFRFSQSYLQTLKIATGSCQYWGRAAKGVFDHNRLIFLISNFIDKIFQ